MHLRDRYDGKSAGYSQELGYEVVYNDEYFFQLMETSSSQTIHT